jgi:glycosyltransferase involved in cell wall biosynthesis
VVVRPEGNRRRALVIAPQPFFTPRGTPFSVYCRTLVTAELGVEVDLLTYGEGQDVDVPGVRIVRIPRLGALRPIPVGPSRVKLFLDVFVVLWTLALLVRHRYDFVHAHEEAVFFCRFLKPFFRFRLVYDMHSSLPQQLVNFGFTRSRLLIESFRWLEDGSLRVADAIITICPALADYALARIDDPGKHFLIENSILEEVSLAPEARAEEQGLELEGEVPAGRRLVVYAGTLEPYQGIDLLIRAFCIVRQETPDVFLLVVGGSAEQVSDYARLAEELGIEAHCRLTGRVPQPAARRLIARAAVQVSPRLRGINTPLKVYGQLASGIPLVATEIRAHTQVLDDEVAFLAAPTPEDFAQQIVAALSREDVRARRTEAAKRRYEERYSRAIYVGKMRALLEHLECAV